MILGYILGGMVLFMCGFYVAVYWLAHKVAIVRESLVSKRLFLLTKALEMEQQQRQNASAWLSAQAEGIEESIETIDLLLIDSKAERSANQK